MISYEEHSARTESRGPSRARSSARSSVTRKTFHFGFIAMQRSSSMRSRHICGSAAEQKEKRRFRKMPALSVHQCRLGTIAESTRQCNSCKDAQVIGPTMRTVVTVLALAAERVFFQHFQPDPGAFRQRFQPGPRPGDCTLCSMAPSNVCTLCSMTHTR